MPGGLRSPNHPFLGTDPATHPNSRGIEAMAISPNGRYLYAALEGATVADGGSVRRLVFEFDIRARRFTERTWSYRTEAAPNMVADMWALDQHRMVLIERDGGSERLAEPADDNGRGGVLRERGHWTCETVKERSAGIPTTT